MDYLKQNTITLFSEAAQIANSAKLTLAQRAIYNIIYCFCVKGKNKECNLSISYFEAWTGMTRPGISKAIDRLVELGLVSKTKYFKDDSLVARCRYTLVETKIKSNADLRAEIKARQAMKLIELQRKAHAKALAEIGLQPLPVDMEGKGYIGLRVKADGSKYLVPDGTVHSRNAEERYYTKEEFANKFNDIHSVGDIDI